MHRATQLLSHRFFGNKGIALQTVIETLQPAVLVRIATAYFEPSGYQCLQDVLAGKRLHLLVGREEGGRDRIEEVINDFISNLTSKPLERRMRAMRIMLDALEQNLLLVSVGKSVDDASFMDARYLYQHAKLYIADESAVVVTSANMSYHGLRNSIEAGIRVTEEEDVRYFVNCFDEFFERADSITDILIEKLRAWVETRSPFEVYIRALLELYGLPEDEVPPQLPALAGYQKPVVSRVLQSVHDYDGAMLIASTGLGKTVMAAHIVAYLRMQNTIDRVLIICPAGLRETWRRFMRAAVTSSAEFSYHTLSGDDPERNYNIRNLEYELRSVTKRTLIILDESHHLRNVEGTNGDERLRYKRILNAVHRSGAKLLMLTATPFSRGIDDVNNQLGLLPPSTFAAKQRLFDDPVEWSVRDAEDLPELRPCVVLTTPTVVKHFSNLDSNGNRYVLFAGDEPRYFPHRLIIRTEPYNNPLDEMLIDLLDSRLLDRAEKAPTAPTLFEMDTIPGETAGFFNAEVMRQFCSSPVQVADLFSKLAQPSGFKKMRFARQRELTQFVDQNISIVQRSQDHKLEKLLDIILAADGQKIVVFCHYVETAKALAASINAKLRGIQAETTADRDIDTVDSILRRFAPFANDVPEEERTQDPIHVLIATGALAEGFNLQDASILVNYDLPWTVLILAQRMGRVLRPWHEPREITIHNFVASTMSNPKLYMAMNWQKRLVDRNRQHRSFADIPVMLEKSSGSGEDGLEMMALARQLTDFGPVDLDLEQTLNFIENAERLQTSSFLDDLAVLSAGDIAHISSLLPGFRSARVVGGKTRLFILFQYKRRFYAVLFDQHGSVLFDSEHRDRIMQEIRCNRHDLVASPLVYPDDDAFDEWIDRARDEWADAHDFSPEAITVVCSMALISEKSR